MVVWACLCVGGASENLLLKTRYINSLFDLIFLIMTMISLGDCTLQRGMPLWNRDSEFTKWPHPAMWHVALKSWHWIRQVAAPCSAASGSGMTCHWIRPNVRHIGILHLGSISTISPQSTCHSAPVSEILSKLDHRRQKKMTSCRFSSWRISAILDYITSYRSSVDTHHSSKLLSFWENCVFAIWRQTDIHTGE